MEFCPKCGAMLVQKNKGSICSRCSYAGKKPVSLETSEKLEEKKRIAVVKEKDSEVLPIVNYDCKQCKNTKAYFWTVQTRASDEAETKFFKCTKCGHAERDYK